MSSYTDNMYFRIMCIQHELADDMREELDAISDNDPRVPSVDVWLMHARLTTINLELDVMLDKIRYQVSKELVDKVDNHIENYQQTAEFGCKTWEGHLSSTGELTNPDTYLAISIARGMMSADEATKQFITEWVVADGAGYREFTAKLDTYLTDYEQFLTLPDGFKP